MKEVRPYIDSAAIESYVAVKLTLLKDTWSLGFFFRHDEGCCSSFEVDMTELMGCCDGDGNDGSEGNGNRVSYLYL